ncbi:MAG: alcohol dehydrogenase catalytic domain-containing protein [Armatimonadota bacterium]
MNHEKDVRSFGKGRSKLRLAQYNKGGTISIVEAEVPTCPEGGLLVQTEACGLCSGELMTWYLDRKVPHVLGHEVAGKVVDSQDDRFPVGSRVFPHHHAPCLACAECKRGAYVHCTQWKRTKLNPGGMAEFFAVSAENLTDTLLVDDLQPREAALIEPLACVVKSLNRVRYRPSEPAVVIGLGVMGLMHLLLMPGAVGFDLDPRRVEWAKNLGLDARLPGEHRATCIIVCPGSEAALKAGLDCAMPDSRICLFAPFPEGQPTLLDLEKLYFKDVTLTTSYSCGPDDTLAAAILLREKSVRAEQVVSDFVTLDKLPDAYQRMKAPEILKAMVVF